MSNHTELKALQTKLGSINEQINTVKNELKVVNQSLVDLEKSRQSVQNEINKLKVKELIVSEHALLRYLERTFGVDLEEIKRQILTEEMKGRIDSFGNGKFPHPDGYKLVVKDRVVVTVETNEKQAKTRPPKQHFEKDDEFEGLCGKQ